MYCFFKHCWRYRGKKALSSPLFKCIHHSPCEWVQSKWCQHKDSLNECCGAPDTIDDPRWLKLHKWEIAMRSQQSVGIQQRGEEGSAGSHVTMYYVKALILSFPLILQALLVPLPSPRVPSFSQWTWLLFLLDMTLYSYCRSSLTVSLFNRAARWMPNRVRLERNGSRNTFILNTPCQLDTVKNLHFEFQWAAQDRRIPSYQSKSL